MDIVVTVPKGRWEEWLTEGDLADGSATPAQWERTNEYGLTFGPGAHVPKVEKGDRCYIVAHGRVRGYAPIHSIDTRVTSRFGGKRGGFAIVRRGDAVAVTIDVEVRGFQNWRYRWWNTEAEHPFPDWKTV